MDVGGQRPADGQLVRAGLLLPDPPGARLVRMAGLQRQQALDQLGPLDTRLRVDDPTRGIERDDPVHPAHVEMHGVGAELLAAHRVPRPGDADAATLRRGRTDRGDDVGDGIGADDSGHCRRVEGGVGVVENDGIA